MNFFRRKRRKDFKSKGNGITIEEWLDYASPESLSLYMYQNPKRAKKLYSDVVPKAVDEYLSLIEKFPEQKKKINYQILYGTFIMVNHQKRKLLCLFLCY